MDSVEGAADRAGSTAMQAYWTLVHAAEAVNNAVQPALRDLSLTSSQITILRLLQKEGPMNHRQISTDVSRSSGNVTTVVDNLERRGLVRRERSRKDRRCVTVHLTTEGKNVATRAIPVWEEEIARVLSNLPQADLESLSKLCDSLGQKIGAEAAAAAAQSDS